MKERYTSKAQRIRNDAGAADPFMELVSALRSSNAVALDDARKLIRADPALLERKSHNGKTPLFIAIDRHAYEAVLMLVDEGANMMGLYDGMTPLEYAVYSLYSQGHVNGRDEPILNIVFKLTKEFCKKKVFEAQVSQVN